MKSFFIFIFIVCSVEAISTITKKLSTFSEKDVVTIEKIIDLQFDVQQIHKDIRIYTDNVFVEVKKVYDELEKSIFRIFQNLALSLVQTDNNQMSNEIKSPSADLCSEKFNPQLSFLKESMESFNFCLKTSELKYYHTPVGDYEILLFSMSERLEKHIHEFVTEYEYWHKSSRLSLSLDEYYKLKKPGFDIILNGLKKIGLKLQNLILESAEILKKKAEECASITELKLNEEFQKKNFKLELCMNS